MDCYFHNFFNAKQAFHLIKLDTVYIHVFIIMSIHMPIHFNIIRLYSYGRLLDFTTKLCKHGLFPSIGLRNKQRWRRRENNSRGETGERQKNEKNKQQRGKEENAKRFERD